MKVLILTVSAGGGHTKAAEALYEEASGRYGKENCMVIDTYKYVNRFLHKLVIDGYINSLKITPQLFAKIYSMTDDESNVSKISRTINSLFSRKIKQLIQVFQPAIILSTHFFPSQMLSNMVEAGKLSIPFITVITDYTAHSMWITEHCNAYVIANKYIADKLIHCGADKDIIFPFGIPVRSQFCTKQDRQMLRDRLGLTDAPAFLLIGGGVGFGNIKEIYRQLLPFLNDIQLIIVCGSNVRLLKQLVEESILTFSSESGFPEIKKGKEKSAEKDKTSSEIKKVKKAIKSGSAPDFQSYNFKNIKIYGYTEAISDLMNASDFIITKPGGVTISEALCLALPIILIDPIPGQEEANELHFLNNGVAYKLPPPEGLAPFMKELSENRFRREQMKEAQKRLATPNSAKDILDLCESLINK